MLHSMFKERLKMKLDARNGFLITKLVYNYLVVIDPQIHMLNSPVNRVRGLPFNIQGGGGQGYWDGSKYFFQYDPAHGYFFPAVRLTNYLFQPLLERLSKIANVYFIKAI